MTVRKEYTVKNSAGDVISMPESKKKAYKRALKGMIETQGETIFEVYEERVNEYGMILSETCVFTTETDYSGLNPHYHM